MRHSHVSTCLSLILLVFALTACAGKDFLRPPEGMLTLGKTTKQEVLNSVGPPEREGQAMKNGRQVQVLSYTYANAYGDPLYSGVVPARVINLGFDADILVHHSFQSSFRADPSELDETKASQLIKGKTTGDQVRELFGRPSGEQIFPFVDQGKMAWIYSYSHYRRVTDLKKNRYSKSLVIRFSQEGIVEDYELGMSGEKE
jgi:hypothetical protein